MMMDDKFFREVQANCWDPEVRIGECDHQHVHVQVLSTVPVMFSYWAEPRDTLELSVFLNDHIAGIVDKWPTRFLGLGTLPMQDPELAIRGWSVANGSGCMGSRWAPHRGGQSGRAGPVPGVQGMPGPGHGGLRTPLGHDGPRAHGQVLGPWLVGMPAETALAITSMIFSGLFEKLPRLRVAFAHGGGSFPATLGRISMASMCGRTCARWTIRCHRSSTPDASGWIPWCTTRACWIVSWTCSGPTGSPERTIPSPR